MRKKLSSKSTACGGKASIAICISASLHFPSREIKTKDNRDTQNSPVLLLKKLAMSDKMLISDDQADMHQRMLELEQELIVFQQSSKELEEALEDELTELENKNRMLVSQVTAKDKRLQELTSQLTDANAEVLRLSETLKTEKAKLEDEILLLKQKLVAMEILNDDMDMNDRILENNLQLTKQFNNELLEKLALVENDLENEKQINAQQRLRISNLEAAEVSRPAPRVRHLQQFKSRNKRQSVARSIMSVADTTADGTILDINEFLATAPPETIHPDSNIPRSGSRGKIHEQYLRSEEIVQKVGRMSHYLGLKANSTIQISPHEAQTPPNEVAPHGQLTHSPSIANLSRFKEEPENASTIAESHYAPSKAASGEILKTDESRKPKHKKNRMKTVMKFFA